MTDIHGYPETRDYRYMHDYPYTYPRDILPFPYFDREILPAAIFLLYALFACLYVLGCVSALPRTGWHDALVAAASCPSLIASAYWESVKKIPYVGTMIYILPGLSLAFAPFALDFYLMFGR